jgi:hypothetical protein
MSQEERTIFWEVVVEVILRLNVYIYVCLIPNCFRDRTVSLNSFKTVVRKEVLHIVTIPAFIVQVAKFVQFTYYNTFSEISQSKSMYFATRVRTWRVAHLYSEIALSRKQ